MVSLLSFFGGLGWQFKAGIIAALCVASFAGGWKINGWRHDSSQGRSIAKAEKTQQKAIVQADKIQNIAQKQEVQTKIIYRTIREQINENNDQRVCFADANALQLWNNAIAGADQPKPEPAAAPTNNGAAESREITATVEQVLINAAENFQICNENAIKHNALIDTIEIYKDKMCVCAE